MKQLLVVFSHGKESGPMGSKIRALMKVAESYDAQTISVNYREDPPGTVHDQDAAGEADKRVAQLLNTQLPDHRQLVLVGSSMGGYVSTVASQHLAVDGLFLMAPAFYLAGYADQDPAPRARSSFVVHGWRDDVVPPLNSVKFARQHCCELHLLDGDHRLNEALPKIVQQFDLFLQNLLATGDAQP